MEVLPGEYEFWTTIVLLSVTVVCFSWMFLVRKQKGLLPFLVLALYASIVLLIGYNEYQYAQNREAVIMEELGFFEGVVEPSYDEREVDPDLWIDSETRTGVYFDVIDEKTRQEMNREI